MDAHHPSDLGVAAYARNVTGRVTVARLLAAVQSIAAVAGDDRALRAEVLGVIRRFVSFDAHAFLLTDPSTTVGCSPVAHIPDLSTLPDLVRLKYLTRVNRWTALPPSGGASLQGATGGRPEQSLLWREYLAGLGMLDVFSAVFKDRYGCWGFLDLWRTKRFSSVEEAALVGIIPAITSRLRAVQTAAFTGVETPHHGPGALVLSPELRVRAQTPQTQDWFAALIPPHGGHDPIPASAYNVAAQLLAIEAGVDLHPARARVHLGSGRWLTLRADRLAGSEPSVNREVMVTMQPSSPAERRDLFSRCHGLSPREDEVLRHLADGVDTRTVARLMSISEFTVQDHLKSVFTKTRTSSRRQLLSRSGGG